MLKESEDETPVDNYRKSRPITSNVALITTWSFLLFANVSYILIELLPWIGTYKNYYNPSPPVPPAIPSVYRIWILFSLFEIIFMLALWAHIRTFVSDPGFIPRGYSYSIKHMTPVNVSLFNYISLTREKVEATKKQ